ncbi:linoleate 13S-lipoxygenase 2-1, chloroplastic-like protein [Tanacetum coccineum]
MQLSSDAYAKKWHFDHEALHADLISRGMAIEDQSAPHESDEELQAWWTEIRTVGHANKENEPWWPQLKTQQDLIGAESAINSAFEEFRGRSKKFDYIIDSRNRDLILRNLTGAGLVQYHLLKPFSGHDRDCIYSDVTKLYYGVTVKGVPYSISI